MTTLTYDVIVLGAGALGSAAAYHTAGRGARVLLLEQFEIDHQRGSSYGYSRIIRYVYDHPTYIRMAGPAFALWRELEAEAGETLYVRTGGIDFGVPGTEAMFDGMIASLRAEGIAHELMTPDEAQRRFPQFRFDDDMAILYQAETGILRASRCVRAHIRLAQARGAVVLENTRVDAIEPTADGVRVRAGAATYSAARLIVTAGGWAGPLLRTLDLDLPLRPVKAQENYFDVGAPADYAPGRFPCFIAHLPGYGWLPYGIPSIDGSGLKVALHGGPDMDPDDPDRTPDLDVVAQSRRFAERYLPGALTGDAFRARPCIYTMTPDEHFIIDAHPGYPSILIGACCSGHAFKFSGLIGRILTDLALDGATADDISLFTLRRFAGGADA